MKKRKTSKEKMEEVLSRYQRGLDKRNMGFYDVMEMLVAEHMEPVNADVDELKKEVFNDMRHFKKDIMNAVDDIRERLKLPINEEKKDD